MLVKELYYLSLLFEEVVLAHYIYYLLHEGKISLEDDAENMNFNDAEKDKVDALIKNNVLGFHKIGIFSLKRKPNQFAFIFAPDKNKAIEHFIDIFHQKPLNCVEILLDYEIFRGNEIISFRELKHEYTEFPAFVGIYERW